jgi:hypothetical protein
MTSAGVEVHSAEPRRYTTGMTRLGERRVRRRECTKSRGEEDESTRRSMIDRLHPGPTTLRRTPLHRASRVNAPPMFIGAQPPSLIMERTDRCRAMSHRRRSGLHI